MWPLSTATLISFGTLFHSPVSSPCLPIVHMVCYHTKNKQNILLMFLEKNYGIADKLNI